MELDVSYNWLGDNSGCSLAVILQKCPLLNTLRIESCGLTSQVFALGKEFAVALKGKSYQLARCEGEDVLMCFYCSYGHVFSYTYATTMKGY